MLIILFMTLGQGNFANRNKLTSKKTSYGLSIKIMNQQDVATNSLKELKNCNFEIQKNYSNNL